MKKTLFSLAILCFIVTSLSAQEKIKGEGYVKFEITKIKSEDAMASMIKGSTIEIYVGKNASRTKMDMMSGMIEMDIINEGKESVTLANMMGNKMKMVSDKPTVAPEIEKLDYKTFKSDTKKILGYKCHKVEGTRKDGSKMICYVTNKINMTPAAGGAMLGNVDFEKLGGFPLEMTFSMGGDGSMTVEGKEVRGGLTSKDFKYNDDGYKTVTEEEFLQLGLGGLAK